MKKLNREEMIEKIIEIHGKKYLFNFFKYTSYKEKVQLICKTHGKFNISLSNLIGNKRGCPECGRTRGWESNKKTTDEFIENSQKIHKNKYSYENVVYEKWNIKVSITCKIHGDFLQRPNTHLNGSGCPQCGKRKRSNKKPKKIDIKKIKELNFINLAKAKHNNKYDYTLVEYQRSNEKVKIVCKKHGIFQQTPHHHKNGSGCPQCAYLNQFGPRLKTCDFISISKNKHNNYYTYTKSNYTGYKNKIIITCPIHGDFKQIPKYHMNGGGCIKCNNGNGNRNRNILKYTTKEYIENCQKIHKNYDYNFCEYKGMKENVKIICNKHKEFDINAYLHINGSGCPKCSLDMRKRTKDEFIQEANEIHNNIYKYLIRDDYVSISDRIPIICNEHGTFQQKVETHLKGCGCNLCKTKSRGEISIINFLNKYNIPHTREKTFNNIDNTRLRFDFWLPHKKTLIEYDGKHHFKPIKYFGGEKAFEKIQINDEIKNRYCIENNINLIRISYKEYKNIKNILKNKLLINDKFKA